MLMSILNDVLNDFCVMVNDFCVMLNAFAINDIIIIIMSQSMYQMYQVIGMWSVTKFGYWIVYQVL